MYDWKGETAAERRARVALWCAASGDVRRWRRWMEECGGRALGHPRLANELTEIEHALTPERSDFPKSLNQHAAVLFVRGQLPTVRCLAVVGSRDVDFEGARLTKRIVRASARRGASIVSGGALGVDTLAHTTALDEGAATVAFLPSALDRATPARNRAMFDAIVEQGGALVSEYPPGVSARRFHFHRRNLLIAAFADAVLVVRAREKGGTMLTAGAAMDTGTPLLVVPGSPEDETSQGCNTLIREGARLVRDADDIFADLGWEVGEHEPTQLTLVRPELSEAASKLLAAFEGAEGDADSLTRRAGIDVATAMAAFLELEMKGGVVKLGGARRYRVTERFPR